METLGEFIDLVGETKIFHGKLWLRDFIERIGQTVYQKGRSAPFNRDTVIELSGWIIVMIQQELGHISTEELYMETKKIGHVFLNEVYQKATQHGIAVALNEIDTPITPSEQMQAAGLVTITPDGLVKPIEPTVLFGEN